MFGNKDIKKCEHGWEIKEEGKLPYKRTQRRISVCQECAIQSALNEMNFKVSLSEDEINQLKEKFPQFIK